MSNSSYSRNMGSNGVSSLYQQIVWSKLPTPEAEYRFAPPRKWRFDLAYPKEKIAIEYEGGTWVNGRHTRGSGYQKDLYKYNTAQLMGWYLLRFTSADVTSGYALRTIEACLSAKPFLDTPDMPSIAPAGRRSPKAKGVP